MFGAELSVIRKLGSLLRPYSGRMGILAVLGVLESVAEAIGISLFIPFLASLDQESFAPEDDSWLGSQLARLFSAVPPSDRLAVISLSIFGLIFLRSALSYVGSVRAATIEGIPRREFGVARWRSAAGSRSRPGRASLMEPSRATP